MNENTDPSSPAGVVPVDEADLAERARYDPQAFGMLYDRYVQAIHRYLADHLGDLQAARDAAASTFLVARGQLASNPPGERFAAWLFGIARDQAAGKHTSEKFETGAVLAGSRLGAAARELGEGEKELLRLRYAARLSPADMGVMLGCSPAAVRKMLERLLARLFNRLVGGQKQAQPAQIHAIENELRSAYQAHQAEPVFVDGLRQHLLSARPVPSVTRSPAGPVWAAVALGLAALALLVALVGTLVAGPQRVWSLAMGWMGYDPQDTQVESVPGLRLVQPVGVEREGVRVSVEQGLASLEQVALIYRVEGLSPEQRASGGQDPVCSQSPALGLPGGGLLPLTGEDGTGWPTGYQMRVVFAPAPPDVGAVNLLLPCLDGALPGAAPENWSIPLRLEPAPAGVRIAPELLLPAPQPSATASASAGYPAGDQSQNEPTPSNEPSVLEAPAAASEVSGVRFAVEQVIEGPNGYLIQGSLSWQGAGWDTVGFDPYQLTLVDANGHPVKIEPAEPDFSDYDPAGQRFPWAILTAGKDFAGPLTLRLPAVEGLQVVNGASFELDLGSEPQPGQTWPVDLVVGAAGQPVNVLSAQLSQDADGLYWLDFKAQVDPQRVAGLTLQDAENRSAHIGGQGGSDGMGLHTQGFSYDYLPEGMRRIEITSIALVVEGGWTVALSLPE